MNKPIIIKPENSGKINEALRAVEGRASERTLNYAKIVNIIDGVERRIGKMSKKALEGTSLMYDHRQHFPNSYKWRAQSTWIKCVYSKGCWRLVNCGRDDCPNMSCPHPYRLELSEAAKTEILRRYE